MVALTRLRETARFLEPGSRSRRLAAEAAELLPDGITRETIRRQPYAPAMTSAHGSVLVDVDGDERTDLLFNHTALIHGHGYAPVTGAVAGQIRQLEAVPFPNEHETGLARLLAGRVPVDEPLFRFTSSGSEAVLLALRLAAAATRRRKIVVFEHCYHGTFVPSSQADVPSSDYLLCPFNAPALLRQVFDSAGPRIAAVLADLCPVSGALSAATAAFAEEIREGCARYGALMIADEVVSSRAAPGGMAAACGLTPDIVCLGSYIGGGLPIGALAMRRDLGGCFGPAHRPRLGHGGTFNGNPLSMTAGIVALEGFGAERAADLDAATAAVCEELNSLFARRGADWSVRRAGSLFCFWPHRTLPASPGQALHHMTRRKIGGLSGFLLRHGVVIAPSGFGCLATATQQADLDYLITAVDAYLTR
jgi:glutamate-1-semialdehyde 2,1-aminomutase